MKRREQQLKIKNEIRESTKMTGRKKKNKEKKGKENSKICVRQFQQIIKGKQRQGKQSTKVEKRKSTKK